jgi:hypothetical protein
MCLRASPEPHRADEAGPQPQRASGTKGRLGPPALVTLRRNARSSQERGAKIAARAARQELAGVPGGRTRESQISSQVSLKVFDLLSLHSCARSRNSSCQLRPGAGPRHWSCACLGPPTCPNKQPVLIDEVIFGKGRGEPGAADRQNAGAGLVLRLGDCGCQRTRPASGQGQPCSVGNLPRGHIEASKGYEPLTGAAKCPREMVAMWCGSEGRARFGRRREFGGGRVRHRGSGPQRPSWSRGMGWDCGCAG